MSQIAYQIGQSPLLSSFDDSETSVPFVQVSESARKIIHQQDEPFESSAIFSFPSRRERDYPFFSPSLPLSAKNHKRSLKIKQVNLTLRIFLLLTKPKF